LNEAFNEPQKISFLPSSEGKIEKPCGGKGGTQSLPPDPRIRGEGRYPENSSGPRTGRRTGISILKAPVLGRKQPGMHGNEKALRMDSSPEGPLNKEVSFQVRCPNPGRTPRGSSWSGNRAKDPRKWILRDPWSKITSRHVGNGLPREHHPWDQSPEPSPLGTG
jgi:hypothetical protein